MISYFEPITDKEGRLVPGVKPVRDIDFDAYLEDVRTGRWQDIVLNVRAGRNKKTDAPGVTPSGKFTHRSSGNLAGHSGFLALDLDAKDNPDGIRIDEIAADEFVYAAHRSISGEGWVVYVRIDGSRHADAFAALEKYFADRYEAIIDPSGKDVSRFRFVSYDPDLHANNRSRIWKQYIPKKKQEARQRYIYTTNDVEHCIKQLTARGLDITDGYHDWVKVGMALASGFGESGRGYFHDISAISGKYNAERCDAKYTGLLATHAGRVSISSFFWLCKNAGVEIKTPRTAHIERVTLMQRKLVGANGGHETPEQAALAAKKLLNDVDMIYGPDVDDVVKQVMSIPDDEVRQSSGDTLIGDVREFLRGQGIRLNEVTRCYEIGGEPITDRDINTLYVKCREVVGAVKGKEVTKDLMWSVLDSDSTEGYNPFSEFFQRNANLKPQGEIERLILSIKVGTMKAGDGGDVDTHAYAHRYVRKWLLSCIASWHGTYSVMMLVLTGEQGEGKTNFFRRLLPDELKRYYAESGLDEGKDSELLMSQKAIICDDEYEGKSKMDYKRIKSLLSKQVFSVRRPYGRVNEDLRRIAVLCGTGNEDEILNDPTGNRRIIPLPVAAIDWEQYDSVDKAALWMELYNEWKRIGNGWMLTKDDIAELNRVTANNQEAVPEEEAVTMFFDHPENGGKSEYMTNTEVRNVIERNSSIKVNQRRLGLVMKKLGYTRHPRKIGSVVKQVYAVVRRFYPEEVGERGVPF